MSFSIYKLLTVILVVAVVGIVLMFLFKVDITKYFEFLPDFDSNKEDKIIEGINIEQVETLQEGETCCCLYENEENTGECKGAKLELNQFCKDKLGMGWVNSDDKYCKNEK